MSGYNSGHEEIIGPDLIKKRDLEWHGYVVVSSSMVGFVMRQMFRPGYFVGDRPCSTQSKTP